MPFITHPNGQSTYYEDDDFTDPWKTHETVLIQPGFGRSPGFCYRVIRRDARGHGRSSAPKPTDSYDYSVDTILEEIINTLDHLGVDKVHWLGESTGGIWGEVMAAKHPNRLLSLTICSTPMYLPPAALKSLSFGYDSWPEALRKLGSRGWAIEAAKLLGTDQISDKAYLKWWIDQVATPTGDALADHAELLEKVDARTVVDDIKLPMLMLAPEKSSLAHLDGEDSQRDLHNRVKTSKLVIVPGHGHEIYIDQADFCQSAFLKFLQQLPK